MTWLGMYEHRLRKAGTLLDVHLASNVDFGFRQRLGDRNPSSKTMSGASSDGMRGGTITDSLHCGHGQPRPTNFSEARSRQRHDGQRNEMRSRITSSSRNPVVLPTGGSYRQDADGLTPSNYQTDTKESSEFAVCSRFNSLFAALEDEFRTYC